MDLREKLKYYREKAGYKTAKEFSEVLGIPYNTYTAYENQKREPKLDMLIEIADLLNVSTDELLGRKDNKLENKDNEYLQKLLSGLSYKFGVQDIIKLNKGALNNISSNLSEDFLFEINDKMINNEINKKVHISLSKKSFIDKFNSIDSSMRLLGKEFLFYYLLTTLIEKRTQDIKENIEKYRENNSNESIDNLCKMIAIDNDSSINTLYRIQTDMYKSLSCKLAKFIIDISSKNIK